MRFKDRALSEIANMICGNGEPKTALFEYRSSYYYLTQFFQDCDTDFRHDGSTRDAWVAATLQAILLKPQPAPNVPPETFQRVIRLLMEQADARNEGTDRPGALAAPRPQSLV